MNCVPVLDAVIFDLDDTLHDDSLSFRSAAAHVAATCFDDAALGAKAAEAYVRELERFWSTISTDAVKTNVRGMRELVWTRALASIDGAPPIGAECAREYDAYRREHFVLWDGVRELLRDLRAYGSRLALLTNGFVETHTEKIDLLGLREVFDVIVISDEVGLAKPDPEIFRLVSDRLGVVPERSTMVGDRYDKDVVGGQSVGMQTIWIQTRGEKQPANVPPPTVSVDSFAGVDAALRAAMSAESHTIGVAFP